MRFGPWCKQYKIFVLTHHSLLMCGPGKGSNTTLYQKKGKGDKKWKLGVGNSERISYYEEEAIAAGNLDQLQLQEVACRDPGWVSGCMHRHTSQNDSGAHVRYDARGGRVEKSNTPCVSTLESTTNSSNKPTHCTTI